MNHLVTAGWILVLHSLLVDSLAIRPGFGSRFAARSNDPDISSRDDVARASAALLGRFSAPTTAQPTHTSEGPDSLTKEELGLRFRDVLAHFRESGELPVGTPCDNMMRTRLPDLKLRRCEARPSGLHGVGLFATRDIAQAELVTLYPGDALLLFDDSQVELEDAGTEGGSAGGLRVLMAPHVKESERGFVAAPGARDYEIKYSEARSVLGNPAICGDPAYLAHLCNDGAALGVGSGDAAISDAEREVYSRRSAELANAAILIVEECHLGVVATRPIAEGDEVLVSYGEGYWLSRAGAGVLDAALTRDSARQGSESSKGTPLQRKPAADSGGGSRSGQVEGTAGNRKSRRGSAKKTNKRGPATSGGFGNAP